MNAIFALEAYVFVKKVGAAQEATHVYCVVTEGLRYTVGLRNLHGS